jgi:hypothetical protein
MGQQQLLLIVLGVIVIGIAIIVGITLFRQSAINNERDLITNENANLAVEAVKYYKKPTLFGGGGYSFTGWKIPIDLTSNATGTYTATVFNDHVIITGTGNEITNGSLYIKVQTTVYPDSIKTDVIN